MRNKIYGSFNIVNDVSSQSFTNHPTLISSDIAEDFNSYINSGDIELHSADIEPLSNDDFGDDGQNQKSLKTKSERQKANREKYGGLSRGVRSIFNKFHAVPLENSTYGVRITQNTPLLDSPSTRRLQRSSNACTVRDLVEKSRQGLMGACVYDYSDFMFCKYLGRVPNNYMITLRRFTIPVNDYIKPYGNATAIDPEGMTKNQSKTDNGGISMGCMVTWLGTPGNEIGEIMKYNFSMPFQSATAKWEPDGAAGPQVQNTTSKGAIGKAFTGALSNDIVKGLAGRGMFGRGIYNPLGGNTVSTPAPHYDSQKAYAGVDQIKSIYIRDPDKGLQFSHKFKLTFDYELRSYNGVNGKQAMLDLLGNILTVCYTTGDFWPGAYRHNQGGAYMQPMSSLECMKHHDTFSGYVQAFQKDFNSFRSTIANALKDPIGTIMNLLDNIGGLFLGGEKEPLPPAFGSGRNALLSDNAVGFWHVTVGNPCAPMMSIGNLVMEDCSVEHYGPLGLDDFPTGLKVTCSFVCGKPRDKRLIERIYGGGNDRIYMPLDQQVIDMLRQADKINKYGSHGRTKSPIVLAQTPGGANPESQKQIQENNQRAAEAFKQAFDGTPIMTVDRNPIVEIQTNINTSSLLTRMFGNIGPQTARGVVITTGEMAEGAPVKTDANPEVTNYAKELNDFAGIQSTDE